MASATLLAELSVARLLWQIRMATFHYVAALRFLEFLVSGPPGYIIALFVVVGNFILPWWKSRRSRHAVTTAVQCGTASVIWLVITVALHHDRSPVKQQELTDFIYRLYSHRLVAVHHSMVMFIASFPSLQGFLFIPLGVLRRFELRISAVRHFALKLVVDSLLAKYSSRQRDNNRARAKRYSYTGTNEPDTIRLLMLHPTLGGIHLKGSLVHASLHSAPRYEAISYCWGDATPKHSITIDDQQLPLTESAFQVLRNRSSFWLPRLIWIDSLCINQQDDDEKASQVQLMGRIYSQAYFVSVVLVETLPKTKGVKSWPGDGQGVLPLLRRFYHALLATEMLDKLAGTGADLPSNARAVTARLTPKSPTETAQWVALRDLFNNPWFGRVWVVQEAVLARRVRVLYNDFEIDWDTLVHAALAFGRFPALWTTLASLESRVKRKPGGVGTVLSIHDYHDRISAGEVIPVSDLLFGIIAFQSTDPRDMVFAIHGMCSELPKDLMKPRYGKTSVNEVYTNAAACLVAAGHANRMLSVAGIGFRSPGATGAAGSLPTWVPNWSIPTRSAQLSFTRPQIDYHAGGTTAQTVQIPSPSSSSAGGRLVLRGWMTDRIVHVAPPVESTGPADQDIPVADAAKLFIDSVLAFTKAVQDSPLTKEPYPHTDPPQSLREAYWRTLVGDRDEESRPAPPSLAANFEKMVAFYAMIQETPNVLDQGATVGKAARERMEAAAAGAQGFLLPLMRCLAGRRLCLTGKGMLGVVPPFSAVGDEIAVFLGMQTPFVVRREGRGGTKSGEYLHVGECFVHGIMDGEVVNGGTEPRTIVLV